MQKPVDKALLMDFIISCKNHIKAVDAVDCSNPDKAVDLLATEMNRFEESLYNFLKYAMKMKDEEISKFLKIKP